MAPSRLGQLSLWLQMRRHDDQRYILPPLPAGGGPLLLLYCSESSRLTSDQITRSARQMRPDLRILRLDAADCPIPPTHRQSFEDLIRHACPSCVLVVGDGLPAGLISAASELQIPLILGDIDLDRQKNGWGLQAVAQRALLSMAREIFISNIASGKRALRLGLPRSRVTVTGPIVELREPLPYSEGERSNFVELLKGRHSWLATCVPPNEEMAVIEAHMATLRLSHRTLLYLLPSDPERIGTIVERMEANNITVARRDHDEEPSEDVQVLIADSTAELGLWYRLAPVTYVGGTLSGETSASRAPFEAAALGSAILHGPFIDRFSNEWRSLLNAGTTRQVENPEELASAVTDLSQPDLAASLASTAWAVSTGGAAIARQIASAVLAYCTKGAA